MNFEDEMRMPTQKQSFGFAVLTTPLAWLYLLIALLRNFVFDLGLRKPEKLAEPVISVGNIAVGGTGKSPIVGYVARHLVERGCRPVVLSRGYGSGLKKGNAAIFLNAELHKSKYTQDDISPDEPRMLSAQLESVPVVICASRIEGAHFLKKALPNYNPTHWILDDGFQHRQLHRDFDIVLLDAAAPYGNAFCLPRGILREPVSSLKRASTVIFTRATADQPSEASIAGVERILQGGAKVFQAEFLQENPRHVCGDLRDLDRGLNLVCAIAEPLRLYQQLVDSKFQIRSMLVKTDHSQISLDDLRKHCDDGFPVLTTEKDYWRDRMTFEQSKMSVYVIPMKVAFDESQRSELLAQISL